MPEAAAATKPGLDVGSGMESGQTHGALSWWCSCALVAAIVLGQTGQKVTLPVFADAIGAAGGTPYFVVWFASLAFVVLFGAALLTERLLVGDAGGGEGSMFRASFQTGPMWVGLCSGLSGAMLSFASPSARTAPHLQALLGNAAIPLTIAVRAAVVGKVPRPLQLAAASCVLLGLFVSLVPSIFGQGDGGTSAEDGIFWPVWFMAGSLPIVFMNVIEEKVLNAEHQGTDVLRFVFCLNFWQFVFVSAFFWLDVVPGYGMSSGLEDWAQHMHDGLRCFLFGDRCGNVAFVWGLSFMLWYMVAYVASALLLRRTEGAVWQAVVMSLVGPLGTVWWALFQPRPSFHWQPAWSESLTFAVLGLGLMVPGVVFYKLKAQAETAEGGAQAAAMEQHLLSEEQC